MLQLSKIIQSRNEWREKAKKKGKELWEMRKVHKYYKQRVANLVEDNRILKEKIEASSINTPDKKK